MPWKSFLRQSWLPVLILVLLLVFTAGSTDFYFPPVSTMLSTLWTEFVHGDLVADLGFSLRNILFGLAIATVVGVAAGLVIGEVRVLRLATAPLLDFARATPTVGFVPVIILALGIGTGPKVFLIFLGSVWPILLNTVSGVQAIVPAVHETARSYRIPWFLRFRRVILPGAVPQIVAGIRVALQIAVILMVVSEIYGSSVGLGNFILQSATNFEVADTWAGTILIGVLGYVLSVALLIAEHFLLGWYHQRPPRRAASRPVAAQPPEIEEVVA
ncbi:ABC-type nitrate/sulfonate/bicarbonate transport system permease component [Amycolatopsis bartoniae]|uniref:Nitrate ABC transporter permease n=1 Tax=Amycolatopsis bartoniae TaxID=941986 RepID=A0A8H9IVH9_9PSEU|nr:ABC transporter permease [Amycolatopsis bartoniae]MBB2940222.1 ABC-type nitrate/sulfonate/bicarbonate transport system permease component [Amycolatopsis bartoniae]TVT10181.1 ABC transporter permease [Amycolatopsis bartoniae]GHF35096.1 nitrate ABC transporter permease [Amycolatopsis bartoniae]